MNLCTAAAAAAKSLQSCSTVRPHRPHQAPPSLGFTRQEYWSGLLFPSPMHACMLSRFSHVWLCVTPWTAAHQAPLSTEFSRQEYWSGLPFPSPNLCTAAAAAKLLQSCPTLRGPMDCSPPGSSLHGIFQARVLELGTIAFSNLCTKNPYTQIGPSVISLWNCKNQTLKNIIGNSPLVWS